MGRPSLGKRSRPTIRLPDQLLERVDGWGAPNTPRNEKIAALIEAGLKGKPHG